MTTNRIINSAQAPATVESYSHSVLTGNTLYIPGRLRLNPQSSGIRTTVEEQAKQAFINLGSILKEVKMIYDNAMKIVVSLQHISNSSKINETYGSHFSEVLPARSYVEVAKLSRDGLFEIEAVAVKG